DIVQQHLAGIVGHVAAGADAGRVRAGALEHVDPLLRVELDRIVLGQGELGPARGGAVPVRHAQSGGGGWGGVVHLGPSRYEFGVTPARRPASLGALEGGGGQALKNCSGRAGPGVGQPNEFGMVSIKLTTSFLTMP